PEDPREEFVERESIETKDDDQADREHGRRDPLLARWPGDTAHLRSQALREGPYLEIARGAFASGRTTWGSGLDRSASARFGTHSFLITPMDVWQGGQDSN